MAIQVKSQPRKRGQALVEAALTLGVFLALVFGAMEFGRAVRAYSLLVHAAREGSRYASVHGQSSKNPATANDIANVVRRQAPGLNPRPAVTVTWNPDNSVGSTVTARARYNFSFLAPFLPRYPLTLRRTSQVTILN